MTVTSNPEMDFELYMDTAVLAGKIMLESNAETYRVEETVTRILNKTGLQMADALALTTGLVATLASPNMPAARPCASGAGVRTR